MGELRELATVEPGHDRKRYVGGSDIAGILNISPWQTPVSVWQKKTDVNPPAGGVPAAKQKLFKRGKRWESVVGEMLVEALEEQGHTVQIIATNNRYIDPEVDFFACEIDYELKLDDIPGTVNAELKTVHPNAMRYWGESGSEESPLYYYAQGMWGLSVTGRQCCILAPLFGADELRVFVIPRDEATIAGMRQKAMDFWVNHVLTMIPPEPLSLGDINMLFKRETEGKVIVADTSMIEQALRYRSIVAQIDSLEAQRDEAEFHIKRSMGDTESVMIGDKRAFSWKAQPTKRLDQEGLKEAHPKIVKEFTKTGSTRVFRSFQFNAEV